MLDDIFRILFQSGEETWSHEGHVILETPHDPSIPDADIGALYSSSDPLIYSTGFEPLHTTEEYPTGFEPLHIEPTHDDSFAHAEAETPLHEVMIGHPHTEHVDPEPYIPPIHHEPLHRHNEPDTYGVAPPYDPIVPYETHWNLADFHGVGHPSLYSHCWQNQTGEDCAVMAQGEILQSITGQHFTEQQLCHLAQEHGWYDPQKGTMPENVGKILEWEGIPVTRSEHATFADLVNALQHEQRTIVGVNANEIWHPHRDALDGEPVKLPPASHAVWVTGVDQAADGSVKVILTDSALTNGQVEAIDVQDFLNAWDDAGNFMVTTAPYASVA